MKYIVRENEPVKFADWKNLKNDNWTPSFNILQGEEKMAVINALMEEQGHICCYCERRLEVGDCHIEHFKPQKGKYGFPEMQLIYDNLLCSCQQELERGEPRSLWQ